MAQKKILDLRQGIAGLFKDYSLAQLISHTIFHQYDELILKDGTTFPVTKSQGGLRQVLTKRHRFIEQNPHKGSDYARRARTGSKIMWVFLNNEYMGNAIARVEDGTLIPLAGESNAQKEPSPSKRSSSSRSRAASD